MGRIEFLSSHQLSDYKDSAASFGFFPIRFPHLGHAWHCHEEYQLIFFRRSQGTLYVGDRVMSYGPGELIFLGQRMPHAFFQRPGREDAHDLEILVLFFHPQFLGGSFFAVPELRAIQVFLDASARGYRVLDQARKRVAGWLRQIPALKGLDRLILLLRILKELAGSPQLEPLASSGFRAIVDERQGQRLDTVFRYVNEHYQDAIRLRDVAAKVYMTPNAFCSFLRRKTGLTLTQVVNKVRITEVCQDLLAGDDDIGRIAFRCGFQNLANFNRRFRELMGLSPREFRRRNRIQR